MKYSLICLLLVTATVADAQDRLDENGVYLSASDYLKHHLEDGFDRHKGYKLNDNKKHYLLIKKDNVSDTFYFDRIWGFRKKGIDWRIDGDEYYQVDFTGKNICIYEVADFIGDEGTSTKHYFSSSISTKVYPLNRRNLIDVFHDNRDFVEKVRNLPPTRSIYKWDKKRGNYMFISWL